METKKNHHRLLLLPAALFLVLLAGIVAGAWYYYQFQETHFKAKVQDELSAVANLKMDQIAAWRKERLADAELLSKGGLLTSEMAPNEKIRDRFRRLSPVLTIYKKDFGYYSLMVTDIAGRVIENVGDTARVPLYVDTAAILQVVSEKKTKVIDFYRCPACGRIHFDVLVPVFASAARNAVAGVVILRRDPEQFLFPLIQTWPVPSRTSETLLFRQEGDSVVYLNELRHRKSTALRLRFPLATKNLPAARVALGQEGFIEGTDYRGVKVFSVGRKIPDSPWFIIAKVDKEEVLAPLRAVGRTVLIVAGLFAAILCSLLVMWWLAYDRTMLLARRKEEIAREQVEEGLLESEERFRNVFDNSSVGKSITSPEGQVNVNRAFCEMLGYTKEELAHQNWQNLSHPDDYELTQNNLNQLKSGEKKSARFIKRYFKKDGSIVWADVGTTLQKDKNGKPLYFITSVVDITERKRAEDAIQQGVAKVEASRRTLLSVIEDQKRAQDELRQSEELYHSLFANMLNGLAYCKMLFDKDRPSDFIYLDVNGSFEKLTGLRNVVGKRVSEAIPGFRESDSALLERYGRVAKTGKPEMFEIFVASLNMWFSISAYCPKQDHFVAVFDVITERKRTEEAIKTSEERFRTAAENLTDVVYDWDIKEKVDWYGDIDGITGYPPGGFPRTIDGWAATIHLEDKDRVMAALEGHLKNKTPYVIEYRVARRDGEWRWWSARGAALRDDRGEPYKMVGSISDITERKNAGEALRESEAKYRTLVENIPQKILMKDRNCRWVSINENLARDFGFRPEEVVGKADADLFSPELAAKYHADDVRIMETGKTENIEEKYIQEGRETWVNTIKTPVRDASGVIVGVLGIFWDITERKRALQQLESNYSLVTALINSPRDLVIFSLDKEYRYTAFNEKHREEMKKVWAADIKIGDNILDFMGIPELRASARASVDRVLRGETFTEIQHQPVLDVYYEFIWSPVCLNNEVTGVTCFVRDITDRKRAEQEIVRLNNDLLQKNAELEQLVYIASHDLRSPLVNVQGFSKEMGLLVTELTEIMRQAGLPAKQQARLSDIVTKEFPEAQNYILASVIKMDALLKGLLKLSRLGRTSITLQQIDMDEMLSGVLKTLEFQIIQCKARVKVEALPFCTGDPDQVNQVFTNLIDNALKYLSPDRPGIILITGKTEKGFSEYCVEDNGIGIAPEHQPKAFEIFHRLNPQTGEGEGLGLAIVKKIVSRLNGSVRLESELGKGSRFYVSLPGA